MEWSRQLSQERTAKEMTRQHTDYTSMYDKTKNSFKVVSSIHMINIQAHYIQALINMNLSIICLKLE